MPPPLLPPLPPRSGTDNQEAASDEEEEKRTETNTRASIRKGPTQTAPPPPQRSNDTVLMYEKLCPCDCEGTNKELSRALDIAMPELNADTNPELVAALLRVAKVINYKYTAPETTTPKPTTTSSTAAPTTPTSTTTTRKPTTSTTTTTTTTTAATTIPAFKNPFQVQVKATKTTVDVDAAFPKSVKKAETNQKMIAAIPVIDDDDIISDNGSSASDRDVDDVEVKIPSNRILQWLQKVGMPQRHVQWLSDAEIKARTWLQRDPYRPVWVGSALVGIVLITLCILIKCCCCCCCCCKKSSAEPAFVEEEQDAWAHWQGGETETDDNNNEVALQV